jgi:pilus assembly protein CpaB
LSEPVHARQVLVRAQLGSGLVLGPGQQAMTIPVKADNGAGGRLRPGDAVQVLVTTDKGKPTSKTEIVIDQAIVYAVGKDERTRIVSSGGGSSPDTTGGAGDAGTLASLTLVLTPDQAPALAHARWNGDLDVVLLPPPAAPKGR